MKKTMQQSLVLNKNDLISLVVNAYGMGLAAGQHCCAAKDDPDFEAWAVMLFSNGFSAMLDEPINKLEI